MTLPHDTRRPWQQRVVPILLWATGCGFLLCVILVSVGSLGGGWLFLAILIEICAGPSQISKTYKWLRERKRNRLLVLIDDLAVLEDFQRRALVRQRIRRRLIRRALASFPLAVVVVIAGAVAALVAIHELDGAPAIVALVAGAGTAAGAVLAVAMLIWRRWSDLFGSPLVMSGTIVTDPSSKGQPEESGDAEFLGMDSLGELTTKELHLDVTGAWRLTRQGPSAHHQKLGLRNVELVPGAGLGMPRSGLVVIACSARGRCIGRLGEFEPRGRHRRDRRP